MGLTTLYIHSNNRREASRLRHSLLSYLITPLRDAIHLVLELVLVQILVIFRRTDFNSLQLQHNIALTLFLNAQTSETRIPTKTVRHRNYASQARARREHEVPLHLLQEFRLHQCTYSYQLLTVQPSAVGLNATYQIDWNAVGAANNLKPNAARMRYSRLRAAIEGPDGTCTSDAANPSVTPTTEGGDAAETPTDTPVTPKKTPKTPKKTPTKKTTTANNESPTKSPTKRKKKEDSDEKPAKKTKNAKAAKNVKTEMEDSQGVDAGVDDAAFHDAHDQAMDEEVEMSPNGAMIEA